VSGQPKVVPIASRRSRKRESGLGASAEGERLRHRVGQLEQELRRLRESGEGESLLVALARRWRITRMDQMEEGRG